jgi:hypothetical protein
MTEPTDQELLLNVLVNYLERISLIVMLQLRQFSFRIALIINVLNQLRTGKFDIGTTFLYSAFDEEI